MKLCCIIIVLFLSTVIYTNEYQSRMTLHSMMTQTKTIMNAMATASRPIAMRYQ